MRLRNGIAVGVSVVLLMAMGTIGILVNRSALRAADTVHRADSRALAVNNGTLAGQVQALSARELKAFADRTLELRAGSAADRAALTALLAKTTFFGYGLTLTDLTGEVLTTTRTAGLPAATHPGYAPMWQQVRGGTAGFSSIMTIGGVALEAVAVPDLVGGVPRAVLIGYNQVAATQLQAYVRKLSASTHLTTIVDSTGGIAATSDPARLGDRVDPAVIAAMKAAGDTTFVEYRSGGTGMIAVVVPGLPGGWFYVRTQTMASFDGAVHRRSQTINLTLLAMLLIGAVGISALGYRPRDDAWT